MNGGTSIPLLVPPPTRRILFALVCVSAVAFAAALAAVAYGMAAGHCEDDR